MFNILKRKPEEISRTTPGFEEAERKTPATGKILLVIMFIAGLYFGWQAIADLAKIPQIPEPLSYCSYRYRGSNDGNSGWPRFQPGYYYNYLSDSSQCQFNKLEKDVSVPAIFGKRVPLEKELESINSQFNSVTFSLEGIKNQLNQLTGEYSVGLQEKQTGVAQPLFPTGPQQQQIISLRDQEKAAQNQQADLEAQKKAIEANIKLVDDKLSQAYKSVFEKYDRQMRWYELKVFLLQFLFIVPFFFLVFWGYLRLHRKNSPYTVIFAAMTGVAGVLLLKVILVWFWGLFLADVLEVLLKWFKNFQILRSLVFYLGMILSFAVFGGAVYWLQKKIFDPRRVTLRRFRAKQCPYCQTNLDLAVFYCPNCGFQIKEKCEKCGQARFIGLPNCPYCGSKK